MVVWLIGLSGSGKTTIGKVLAAELKEMGRPVIFMDGDIFREMMGNDLGHTMEDRKKNSDRICKFCKRMDEQGIDVVFAVLSIFHESQDWNRENIKNYFELFLDVSIEKAKWRDRKGIYSNASVKNLTNVVGLDIPFPRPKNPDMTIDNNYDSTELTSMVDDIIGQLKAKALV